MIAKRYPSFTFGLSDRTTNPNETDSTYEARFSVHNLSDDQEPIAVVLFVYDQECQVPQARREVLDELLHRVSHLADQIRREME